MASFGYPRTLVREYDHWVVLLRSKQVTLGSCVLICREPAEAFSDISAEAFAEFGSVIVDLEHALSAAFSYDKINYLMLMMVDRQVHFHVILRYAELVSFEGKDYADPGWPGLCDLSQGANVDEELAKSLIGRLKNAWEAGK